MYKGGPMKKLLSFSLLLAIVGCSNSSITESLDYTPSFSHDYDEVGERFITWESLFDINNDWYFVYVFSYTCGHCQNIKNEVIEYSLNHDNFYFVEYSKDIPILATVEETINQTEIQYVGILGTPSLLEVYNKVLINNVAGEKEISKIIAKPA